MADQRTAESAAAARRLRSLVDQGAREAAAAKALLEEATTRFTAVSVDVVGIVGGSSQHVDRLIVDAMAEAVHYSNDAIAALAGVTRTRL